MTDAVTARIVDARTVLQRACVGLSPGETRSSLQLALAALGDAPDAYEKERLQKHFEVLADALAAPGRGTE